MPMNSVMFQKQPNFDWAFWKFSHPLNQTDKNVGKMQQVTHEDRLHMINIFLIFWDCHSTCLCILTEALKNVAPSVQWQPKTKLSLQGPARWDEKVQEFQAKQLSPREGQ